MKKKRPKTIYLERRVGVIFYGDEVLVRQEKEGRVMAGLYEFPYTALGEHFPFDFSLIEWRELPLVKHGFTRYDVTLYPFLYKVDEKKSVDGFEWKRIGDLSSLPFSSGHRRILEILKDHAYFTH